MPASHEKNQATTDNISSGKLSQDSITSTTQFCQSETGSAGRAGGHHTERYSQKRPWEHAMPRTIGMKRIPLK